MNTSALHTDFYAPYRNIYLPYIGCYLKKNFHLYSIKKHLIIRDANLSEKTLNKILEGKNIHFDCYIRLLFSMREYYPNDDVFLAFILEFIKRALVEVHLIRSKELDEWMPEVWERMQKDRNSPENEKQVEIST